MSDAVQKEVDKLLKNREKYEGWLKRLESEKTATTERAYERVRVDYQARLDEVTNQLRSHSDTINGKLRHSCAAASANSAMTRSGATWRTSCSARCVMPSGKSSAAGSRSSVCERSSLW
jgi:hypothetical protein